MKYVMRPNDGFESKVDLSKQQYEDLLQAKVGILMMMEIEERFSMFRENFADYQRDLFESALKNATGMIDGWNDGIDVMLTLNRRLLNLLSSARLYRDHVYIELGRRFGKPSWQLDFWNTLLRQAKSESLAYRFLERFRNHVQHCSLPIRRVAPGIKTDCHPHGTPPRHHVAVYASWNQINDDRDNFDVETRAALKPVTGDRIDLNRFVREYAVVIAHIHSSLTEGLKSDIEIWETLVEDALERVVDTCGSSSSIVLAAYDENSPLGQEPTLLAETALFLAPIKRRRELHARGISMAERFGPDQLISTA
jgi:hypothetical protein